ncbi:cysteine desulfurase NifS [Candidatus Hydrogenedentota bacterium]
MKTVYVDNNATTQVADEVYEAMKPFFCELYGNPSSMHDFGGSVASRIEDARAHVAHLINADPSEIVFTSCGTESDNTAIQGVLSANPGKRHIVTSRVEHPAVHGLCIHLASKGYQITEIPVDEKGMLNVEDVRAAITDDTAIVSIMMANNETGVIFPVEEIGNVCREKGAPFHTDAVQAVGKVPLDMATMPIDLLSISGHKLHAPKGIGVLYIRKGVKVGQLLVGGHQEKGRRGGTENVASIVGFGEACRLAEYHLEEENTRVRAMRDRLEEALLANCRDARLNGHKTMRLPNTTNISFEYVEGEAILLLFNELGICASSGSACTSGSLEPSHVLRAMGVPFTAAHGSIRFSLSIYNSDEEIDYIIEKVPPIIERLREISLYGRG